MSLLESFFIMFESDADEARKDVDGLSDALENTEYAATEATDATDGTGASFVTTGKAALGAVGGILALGSAVAGLVAKAQQLDTLGKFSDLIGENIGDVDAWSEAVIRAGGTSDGFRQTLESLNEKMVDASVRGTNEITPFFNQLGVSIIGANDKVKSTLEILPELATAFEGLDRKKSLGLGKKLGLDASTIALLQQGRVEVDAMIERQRALGVATEESAELSAKFNDSMADFKQVSGFAAQSLLVNVIPAMTWLIDRFTDLSIWANDNKAIVYGFFIGLGAVAIPTLISLAAAGWAAIAPFLIAAAPFIAIAAAAAAAGVAIGLVIEDVIAFTNGQDSLIGKIAEDWPIVGDVVRGIVDEISNLVDIMKTFASFMVDIFTDPQKVLDGMVAKFEKVKSFFGFGGEGIENNVSIGQESINLASTSPIGSQTSSSIQNSTRNTKSTSVQTGDIIIQTPATDIDGIARDGSNAFKKELRSVVDSFDDGVAA